MKQIISTIQREKGYDYRIDRQGNIIKSSYSWFKDWRSYLLLWLLLIGYLYYSEVKQAREYVNSPCVHQCLIKSYIEDFKTKNPNLQIQCNYELGTCQYSGVYNASVNEWLDKLRGLNLSVENG